MSSIVNIVIDSETWGTRAGFDCRSIGACVFDPLHNMVGRLEPVGPDGEEYYLEEFYINTENRLHGSYSDAHYSQQDLDQLDYRTGAVRSYRLKRDPETVKWWYEQSAEAQAAFANPVDLKIALESLSDWLDKLGVNPKDEHSARIWSHGRAFDPPIIEELYHAVGLPVPWHYRAPRDTRTAFDLAQVGNHSAWMKKHRVGTLHNALDDAKTTALAICAAIRNMPN